MVCPALKRLALLLFATAGMAVFSWPLSAQQVCGDHNAFVATLENTYGERRVSVGIAQNEMEIFEIFAAPDGSTWTILRTFGNGRSCVIASGRHYQKVEGPAEGDGA